jgi:hypothetical protein
MPASINRTETDLFILLVFYVVFKHTDKIRANVRTNYLIFRPKFSCVYLRIANPEEHKLNALPDLQSGSFRGTVLEKTNNIQWNKD